MMLQHLFTVFLAATYPPSIVASPPAPTFAPVPETGLGPEIDPVLGYRVESFGAGAYMISDGVYQSAFLVSTEGVIALDAPPSIGHNILRAIGNVTDLPITHVVYSHAHADHISAAYLLVGSNTTVIAHKETVTELGSAVNTDRPLPNVTFDEEYELIVGNQTLVLSYKGTNHQVGNIFIYAPVQKMLMLVDVITPGWIPYHAFGISQSIPGLLRAHDQVLDYDFDYFVGGHMNRVGTREDALTLKEYLRDVYNNCVEAALMGAEPPSAANPLSDEEMVPAIAAANPNNGWEISSYMDGQRVNYCVNKTNTKWWGRLAALDVYSNDNALYMLESIKVDFGILGGEGVAP